jgi:hypothetical protein
MTDANAASDGRDAIPARPHAARDAERFADTVITRARDFVHGVWDIARFALFIVYAVLAMLSIWLWLIGALVSTLRFGVRAVMLVFLWLSGGTAPRGGSAPGSIAESIERDLRYLWRDRLVAYRRLSRGLAEQIIGARNATRTFWSWALPRKAFALAIAIFMVGIPLMFVIPRPQYVQITDDNALQYDVSTGKMIYLVHAVDLFDATQTREYINEDAVHLGKLNSQGLKAQLVPGRYYRLWIVGIRWWKFPRLFPNIIKAQEVDAEGNVLDQPSHLLPHPNQPPQ